MNFHFAFVFLGLVLCVAGRAEGAEVASFTGDFESGDLSQWAGKEAARDDSIQIVTDPVRSGRYAARFTVRAGERVSNGNRAEVFHDNGDRAGSEVWYRWSFLIPDDFVDVEWKPKLWQCIGQWHDQPDKSRGETWANFPVARLQSRSITPRKTAPRRLKFGAAPMPKTKSKKSWQARPSPRACGRTSLFIFGGRKGTTDLSNRF